MLDHVYKNSRANRFFDHFSMAGRRLVPYSDSSSSEDEIQPKRLSLKVKEKKKEEQKKEKKKEEKEENVDQYFEIKPRFERRSRKFKTQSQVYDVTFQRYNQPFTFTPTLFEAVVQQMKRQCNAQPRDKIRISMTHPKLSFGIHVPFDNASQITGERLLDEIEKVAQSNHDFKIHDGQMQAEITHISMPEGSARTNRHYGSYAGVSNMTRLKRSIIQIRNDKDSMCLARAVVVGMHHANKTKDKAWVLQWDQIRRSGKKLQRSRAQALLDRANIAYDQPCGITEYQAIQAVLYPAYVIKIHTQHGGNGLLFKSQKMKSESKVIHVFHHDGHYDTIVSVTGFLGRSYYCEHCDIGYQSREAHWCHNVCVCSATERCPETVPTFCSQCNRWFRSPDCLQKHREIIGRKKKSICDLVHNCRKCRRFVILSKKNHLCPGTKKCKYCKHVVGPDHDCFIPKYHAPEPKKEPKVKFIFYDFECQFDSGEHIPNFCVAQRACHDCIRKPLSETCATCDNLPAGRQAIFRGDRTLADFCTWLFQPLHKGATAIAHNAQGYDAQFILRYLVTQTTMKPELIMNGSKILLLKAYEVRLIDSMSFLAMPLAAFPKTFGLSEMAKGYFPFWANTKTFQNYIGPYLPVEYYKPGSMKPDARQTFLTWYEDKVQQQAVFDFQKEMELYCISDVDILRRGCGEFQYLFKCSDQIDPFIEATTLAQACNLAWRKNSMPAHSFAIISDVGYPNKVRYSVKGVRWLQAMRRPIRHALNGGEVKIGPYTVDGFDASTNTVYEFLGCFYHGCPTCFPKRDTKNPYTLESMNTLYGKTQERLHYFERMGYEVVTMWECEFDKQVQSVPDYKTMIDQFYPGMDPIKPRDALFGGRTNAVQLYFEVKEPQEIKYADICSLYPYVNKYKAYPIGHPTLLSQEHIDKSHIAQYKGLVKCKVLPPQDLWMPVLPIHCQQKMVFTLCKTCAEQEMSYCKHTVEERALTGTWTSVELKKALDLGYQLLDVYYIWHWEEWSTDVYKKYINKYLRMKQEASGYPDWVKTENDKLQFKKDYFQAEGIELKEVEKNPGKRAFAKTMLNCLWGKNAQSNVLPKTEYVEDLPRFYEILSDKNKQVRYLDFFDHDGFVLMNFTDEGEMFEPHTSANVVVASFVTAYARLELYAVLERLGQRVLYFDTDSCMYVYDPDQYNIPIVDSRLGKWTDEVPDGKIVKFVSLGPKNYGYEYIVQGQRHTKCKVKGITLDYNTSQLVNFDKMVECLEDREQFSLEIEYPSRIRRHRNRKVTSEKQTKTFRSVYTKRVVVSGSYKTVPYGYHHW